MRLSPNKIEYLADRVVTLCQESPQIHLTTHVDTVWKSVVDAIYSDMRAEEAIDNEVDELLAKHKLEIQGMEMDVGDLRRRFKREVCRKHGFIL